MCTTADDCAQDCSVLNSQQSVNPIRFARFSSSSAVNECLIGIARRVKLTSPIFNSQGLRPLCFVHKVLSSQKVSLELQRFKSPGMLAPTRYMGKTGSICHFSPALSGNISGHYSQVRVFTEIRCARARGSDNDPFVLIHLCFRHYGTPNTVKRGDHAKIKRNDSVCPHPQPLPSDTKSLRNNSLRVIFRNF